MISSSNGVLTVIIGLGLEIMLTHGVNHECYKCICRVCGQASCPHRGGEYKRCFSICYVKPFVKRPILDCANFYLQYFPKYRIKRVYKSPQIRYVDKTNADDIRVMLTEILQALKPNGITADVNCVRHDCLCLKCPLADRCNVRCRLCKNYKGQHPVKMCGNYTLYLMRRW